MENIGIIFKKNVDGIYCYKEVITYEGEPSEIDNIGEYNVITLDKQKYSDILEKKNISIIDSGKGDKSGLLITIDNNIYKQLVEKLINSNEKNPVEYIKSSSEKIFKELAGIEFKNSLNGLMEYIIDFDSKKEYNSEEMKEGLNSKIDVSKISPEELVNKVKEKIIGQDKAIKDIVYNVHNNQVMIDSNNDDYLKATMLLDGPSGSGKSAIIKSVAKELSIPMIVTSASHYSAAGYKGASLSDILVRLLEKTDGDFETAQRGIIAFDEFDKLGYNSTLEMKQAVQHDLLSFISGEKVPVEYKGKTYEFDTKNITFICMGAFEKLRERKINEGLDKNASYKVSGEDYIKEGFAAELINRFSVFTTTKSLDKNDLVKILKESKTSTIKQLRENAKMHNKELIIDDDMIEKIAVLAFNLKQEARGLEDIVEGIRNVIFEDLYNKEIDTIVINDEVLKKSLEVNERKVMQR